MGHGTRMVVRKFRPSLFRHLVVSRWFRTGSNRFRPTIVPGSCRLSGRVAATQPSSHVFASQASLPVLQSQPFNFIRIFGFVALFKHICDPSISAVQSSLDFSLAHFKYIYPSFNLSRSLFAGFFKFCKASFSMMFTIFSNFNLGHPILIQKFYSILDVLNHVTNFQSQPLI